jgi:hypothetical protein
MKLIAAFVVGCGIFEIESKARRAIHLQLVCLSCQVNAQPGMGDFAVSPAEYSSLAPSRPRRDLRQLHKLQEVLNAELRATHEIGYVCRPWRWLTFLVILT